MWFFKKKTPMAVDDGGAGMLDIDEIERISLPVSNLQTIMDAVFAECRRNEAELARKRDADLILKGDALLAGLRSEDS